MAARRTLGPTVGTRRFGEYVRQNYGRVEEPRVREFLRSFEYKQVFAPPVDSRPQGRAAITGYNDGWYVDIIDLKKRTPEADPMKMILLA